MLQAVHEVAACLELEVLALNNNAISNLVGLECLQSLRILLLKQNAVDSMLQMRPLSIVPTLQTLAIAGNPIALRMQTPQALRATLRNLVPSTSDLLFLQLYPSASI